MRTIRVGSRESKLAVIQSELVMEAIRAKHPEITLELEIGRASCRERV